MRGLPSATEGSVEVAKLTTGICIAITSVFLPGVGLLGPIAEFAINKFVKRPEAILVDELKRGNLEILDVENAAAFIPMAYKFFEAAKEGEYEHNLKLLAQLLVNKLRASVPDVSSFARMSRRIEGLTLRDLRVIALIDAILEAKSGTLKGAYGDPVSRIFPFVGGEPAKYHGFGDAGDTRILIRLICARVIDCRGRNSLGQRRGILLSVFEFY